jgi:hypothetical protein
MPAGTSAIRYQDDNVTITCTDSCSTSYVVWQNWNQNYTVTTGSITVTNVTYVNDNVWTNWNDLYTTGSASSQYIIYQPDRESERRMQEQYRREAAERQAREARAASRALRILKSVLSPEQARQFDEHQFFEVQAQNGTVRYLLARGRSANVYRLDAEGKPVKRFCVHPGIACPDEDTLLAQKLLLETNPAEFERLANVHQMDDRGRRLAQLVQKRAA